MPLAGCALLEALAEASCGFAFCPVAPLLDRHVHMSNRRGRPEIAVQKFTRNAEGGKEEGCKVKESVFQKALIELI